jgi:putative ABC transport system permease protein
MNHVPVAWLQLTRDTRRLAAAVAGIAFAAILMLIQLGLYAALHESATKLIERLRGDLILTSSEYQYLFSTGHFTRRRLYSALAVPAVQSVAPLYLSLGNWRNPQTLEESKILVIGFIPDTRIIQLPEVPDADRAIALPDAILFDALSRPEYGPVAALFARDDSVTTEVSGRTTRVVGLFSLGPTFGSNGHIVTSDLNFVRLFPEREIGLIDVGLIQLKPGADVAAAQRQIRAILPRGVNVLTRAELTEQEIAYWNNHVPLGFVFRLGALMGLMVGGVIVYQILFSDVSDQLSEYATLKAMGYLDRSLFAVVLKEALLLSVAGFVPGYLIAQALYYVAHDRAGVPIHMTPERVAAVFALTVLTCVLSGAIAMRKVKSADPADVF